MAYKKNAVLFKTNSRNDFSYGVWKRKRTLRESNEIIKESITEQEVISKLTKLNQETMDEA